MAALWARLQCTVRIRGSFSRCLSLLVFCLGRKCSTSKDGLNENTKHSIYIWSILNFDILILYYSVYFFKHICIFVFYITWGNETRQQYHLFVHLCLLRKAIIAREANYSLKPKRCRRVRFWTRKIPSMRAKWPRHGAQCRKERRWKAGYSERAKVQNLIFTTWLYIAFHFQLLVSTSTNCLPKFQSGLTLLPKF